MSGYPEKCRQVHWLKKNKPAVARNHSGHINLPLTPCACPFTGRGALSQYDSSTNRDAAPMHLPSIPPTSGGRFLSRPTRPPLYPQVTWGKDEFLPSFARRGGGKV